MAANRGVGEDEMQCLPGPSVFIVYV